MTVFYGFARNSPVYGRYNLFAHYEIGVWDVLTDQEAVELILSRYMMEGPFSDAADVLVRMISMKT